MWHVPHVMASSECSPGFPGITARVSKKEHIPGPGPRLRALENMGHDFDRHVRSNVLQRGEPCSGTREGRFLGVCELTVRPSTIHRPRAVPKWTWRRRRSVVSRRQRSTACALLSTRKKDQNCCSLPEFWRTDFVPCTSYILPCKVHIFVPGNPLRIGVDGKILLESIGVSESCFGWSPLRGFPFPHPDLYFWSSIRIPTNILQRGA